MKKLSEYVIDLTIRDADVISVYDTLGNIVSRGHWFDDQILNCGGMSGVLTFTGIHKAVFNVK